MVGEQGESIEEIGVSAFSHSDMHLLLLHYYGGSFSAYSTNYYLLDKINKETRLYRALSINDTLNTVTGANFVTPLAPESQGHENIVKLILLTHELAQSKSKKSAYEENTINLLLGHLYLLVSDTENSLVHLKNVSIDLAKLTDLALNDMDSDTDIVSNYHQYCAIKKTVLQALISKSMSDIELFLNAQLLNVPSVSNVQGKYWLNILFNTYFKLLLKSADEKRISFELLRSRVNENDLILVVLASYFYNNFKKYLSADFKKSFAVFFEDFIDVGVYKNSSLKFPLSNETNYSLETLIYVLVDSIKDKLARRSYYDSKFSPADLAMPDPLFDLGFLDSLVDFSLSKTYQSIKIHNSMVFLKILRFQISNHRGIDLDTNYKLIVEIFSILKNFKTYYEQFALQLHKKNIKNKLLDEDNLLLIQTYTAFLDFATKNLNLAENENFNYFVLDKNTLKIDPVKVTSLSNFNKLFREENLVLLDDIETKLNSLTQEVMNLTNIDLKIHDEDYNVEDNQINFVKTRLSSSKILNLLLSNAYHAIVSKKLFILKINKSSFKKFLDSNKLLVLHDFKMCLALNGFNNLNFYFEYIVYLLRFYRFDTYSKTIIFFIQKLLTKNFNYWKCWNLLLILANSNYGIEVSNSEFSFGASNANQNADFGLALTSNISVLLNNYLKLNSELVSSKYANSTNELKKDILELKISELKIIGKKQGYEQTLAKLPELFELFHTLFEYCVFEDQPAEPAKKDNETLLKNGLVDPKGSVKLLRFHTFRKNKITRTTSLKPLVSSKKSLPSNVLDKVFASKLLQKCWLFASSVYLNLNMLKEAEYSIVEAENSLNANEFTTYQFAKLLEKSSHASHNSVNRKLFAFNEYERSIDILNSSISTSNFRLSESFKAVTGLASLVLNESIEEDIYRPNESFINDLDNIDYSDIGAESVDDGDVDYSDTDSEYDHSLNSDSEVETLDLKKLTSLSTKPATISPSQHNRLIFINENDETLAILRVKLLIENNLCYNYYYFNHEQVWSCLNKIYHKLNDELNYEKALEKTISIQENKLVRDLKMFDIIF